MSAIHADPHKRLYLAAAGIFAGGWAAAIHVYLTAGTASVADVAADLEDSRQYLHDLELYGGRMNVLAAGLSQWFSGLWQGRPLAFTLAVITALVAAGLCLVAYRMSSDAESADGGLH